MIDYATRAWLYNHRMRLSRNYRRAMRSFFGSRGEHGVPRADDIAYRISEVVAWILVIVSLIGIWSAK